MTGARSVISVASVTSVRSVRVVTLCAVTSVTGEREVELDPMFDDEIDVFEVVRAILAERYSVTEQVTAHPLHTYYTHAAAAID